MPDICYYCDNQYHPMPVYEHKESRQRIHVCHYWMLPAASPQAAEIDEADIVSRSSGQLLVRSPCRQMAEAQGYQHRRDLTPKR